MIVMTQRWEKVRPKEIADFLAELSRVVHLGSAATTAELLAVQERKAELLRRMARHPGPVLDAREAIEVAELAERTADKLRAVMVAEGEQ